MRIELLAVRDFPPFAEGVLNFPTKPEGSQLAEVHLITGQNGAGKTRLLSLLAASLGNDAELKCRLNGKSKGVVGGNLGSISSAYVWPDRQALSYGSGRRDISKLIRGELGGFSGGLKDVLGDGQQKVASMAFRGVAGISDAKVEALKPVPAERLSNNLIFEKNKDEDAVIGQSMVNIKMVAAMDSLQAAAGRETRATRMSAKLEAAISKVTGREFSFWVTPYPDVSLKVNWGGTQMRLRQLPDGLRSIIGWLVACIARLDALFPDHEDPLSIPLILLLDEPEGHLHPAWQRKLLPAAQALFPNGQFFVATHSPFIISSVNEGWIHVLRANDDGLVTFEEPRQCSKGDSYMEIVEDILGVKEWYDPESEALLKEFRALKNRVLDGGWDREAELRKKAQAIAQRSESLGDLIGGEMRQFERLKQKAPVAA